jgi:nicotinate phosphoribosyltransferase
MKKDKPIIDSPLDTDIYKHTMGQFVFLRYPDVLVRYAFKNRTKDVKLGKLIDLDQLREELDHFKNKVSYNNTELHYLRGTNEYQERMFVEPYLEFLKSLKVPDYDLETVDGDIKLEFAGKWSEAIYWEVPALSIIYELYTRAVMTPLSRFEKELVYAEGRRRLAEKIRILRKRRDITFVDFGTRRRFNKDWQQYVIEVLKEELPDQFRGTSNVKFAMDMGLVPMGTSAHELNMVITAVMHESDEEIRRSQEMIRREWWDQYGWGLSINLPDTYGSKFTFDTMTAEEAHAWKGFRHDSGPPQRFAKWVLGFYERRGVDAKEKIIIFSDGLRVETMIGAADYIHNQIRYTYGWGTDEANDLGIKPVSIVVKPIEANGIGLVKLSDNPAKAIGKPEDIEEAKRIFGYDGGVYEECVY